MRFDRRLLRLAQTERFTLGLAISLGLFSGAVVVIQAQYFSKAVSRVYLRGSDLREVQQVLVALLLVICARAVLVYGAEKSASLAATRIITRLRQQLYDHIIHLGPIFTRQERTGELISTCLQGVDALEAYFSKYLPQVAIAVLVPLTYLVLIFPLDAITGFVLLLTAPLIPIFMVLIGSLGEALTEKQWHTLRRLSAYFYDLLQGLTTLKTMGRSQAQVGVLHSVDRRYRQITMGVLRVTFLSALALEMVATLGTAVVAVEIGLRLLYGRLEFEQALFLLLLAPEFYLPLRSLGARFHAAMSGFSAASRIFTVLDIPLAAQEAALLPVDDSDAGLSVVVDHLSYSYPEQDRYGSPQEQAGTWPGRTAAVSGVSLELAAGECVALVGPSGAGKSTLVSLLLGFAPASGGEIRINRKPLGGLSTQEWQRGVAWVPQHPYIFNDSVLKNIRLAKPDATREEVVEAARLAHAHEFIINLPLGYDTQVGERGSRLSGGEVQRIALARAFLKDAPVLILDEATSSLDPELEVRLQESITSLMKERTTLVIAHRLSTVYRADRIYVMEAGRIVESGSHSALMAREGLYHMMVGNYTGWESASALSDPGYVQRLKQRRGDSGTPADNPLPIHSMLADTEPRTDPVAANQGYTAEPGIRIFQRLLKLVLPYRNQIMLSVLLGVLTIGSGIGLMAASAYIISAAALGPSIAVLQVPIVGVRAFGISRGVFRYLERYISHRTTFLILSRLRVWFYQSLEPLAPARLDGYRGGDLLNRAIGDIASLESLYVRGLAPPLVALVVAVVTSFAMATFSPILGLNLLGFLLLTGAGVSLLGLQGSRSAGSQLVLTRGALSARLADGILGAADLLMSDQRCIHSRSVETLNQKAAAHHRKLASNEAVQSGMLTLLTNLGMWTSLLLAIPLVHTGQMDGVYLAVTALVVLTSFEAVLPLPQAALHLESNLEAAGRLFEVLDTQPEVIDPAQPADPPISAEIQITELSFRYPYPDQAVENMAQVGHAHQQPFALEDISLTLPAGKHMAVIGPSGAGKSTLVKLLLRYWDYRSGVINFGGRDLRDFSAEDVRQRLAVVEQNPYLFNTSIRHNLLIANPTAGEDELIRAARGAHIYEMIQSQPLGFDTLVGESGLRISGGERQRLAIARALLRRSSLLVLDEPSANLDTLVERQIMETVVDAMQGKTTLLITHRLVGLERMDEILVLDRGRIIERGRHYELLAAGGLYYRMWQTQNQIIGTN